MDSLLVEITDYVHSQPRTSQLACETARLCLLDSLACGFLALSYPQCRKMLGPVVPGAEMVGGCRVPGTTLELDPVKAAFDIGAIVRWLDFNDTWLAAEWGHPSDNLGAILATADYQDRVQGRSLTVADVLTAMIKAYEIQGVLALENSLNRVGLDHVLFVRIASTAVASQLFGCTPQQTINALSNAWIDGAALRIYRQAPNAGSRKSWAAGDATSRAVRLALIASAGEMGYPTALSAKQWGFSDVLFRGQPIKLARPLGSFVMENVLWKVSFPAEFHAQTAVECALLLYPEVKDRHAEIERIELESQEPGLRITDKKGPLKNFADRDHCLQFMVAVGLTYGELTAEHYSDRVSADPRIDELRAKMIVRENPSFTRDYYDLNKRAIGNSVQVFFKDGTRTQRVEILYPMGHRRRREEGIAMLKVKFENSLQDVFERDQIVGILQTVADPDLLDQKPVREFMDMLSPKKSGIDQLLA